MVANAGLAVLGLCYIAVVIQSMGAAEFVGLSSPTSEAGASSDGASVQRSGGVARDNGLRKRVHTSTGDAADTGGGGSGGSGGGTAAAAGTVVDGADGGGHIEPFNPVLVTTGFYGFSRHPMYTGLLFVLFCTPAMTVDRFVFSVGLLAYLLSFGIRMEEAKLLDVFGPPYAECVSLDRCCCWLCRRADGMVRALVWCLAGTKRRLAAYARGCENMGDKRGASYCVIRSLAPLQMNIALFLNHLSPTRTHTHTTHHHEIKERRTLFNVTPVLAC